MNCNKSIENLLHKFQSYNQKDTFGNQILYDMCNPNKNAWGDADRLADKIWLIGRSYAASPERRYTYDPPLSEEEKKIIQHSNGTGDYFYCVAQYLCSDGRLSQLSSQVSSLLPLRFDESKNDIEALLKSVECVALFNSMIKDASSNYDKGRNSLLHGKLRYRNQISFCSKFLHFHAPNNFFIIDHFSQEGGRLLCSLQTRKSIKLKDCDAVIDKTIRKNINAYCTQISISVDELDVEVDERARMPIEYYIEHCLNAYGVGCFLVNNLNLSSKSTACSIPRIVDSIFQRVEKAE